MYTHTSHTIHTYIHTCVTHVVYICSLKFQTPITAVDFFSQLLIDCWILFVLLFFLFHLFRWWRRWHRQHKRRSCHNAVRFHSFFIFRRQRGCHVFRNDTFFHQRFKTQPWQHCNHRIDREGNWEWKNKDNKDVWCEYTAAADAVEAVHIAVEHVFILPNTCT